MQGFVTKVYHDTFILFNPKHINRYVNEFVTRYNIRKHYNIVMMRDAGGLMRVKKLNYKQLMGA